MGPASMKSMKSMIPHPPHNAFLPCHSKPSSIKKRRARGAVDGDAKSSTSSTSSISRPRQTHFCLRIFFAGRRALIHDGRWPLGSAIVEPPTSDRWWVNRWQIELRQLAKPQASRASLFPYSSEMTSGMSSLPKRSEVIPRLGGNSIRR